MFFVWGGDSSKKIIFKLGLRVLCIVCFRFSVLMFLAAMSSSRSAFGATLAEWAAQEVMMSLSLLSSEVCFFVKNPSNTIRSILCSVWHKIKCDPMLNMILGKFWPYEECEPFQNRVSLCAFQEWQIGALCNLLYIFPVCEPSVFRSSLWNLAEFYQIQNVTKYRMWPNAEFDQMQSLSKFRIGPN